MNIKTGRKLNSPSFGLMEGIVLFVGLFVCIYVAFRKIDPDLFFIMNNGKYILSSGDFFPQKLFSSIHYDFSTVIQQPLWSVIIYLLFDTFGISAIPVFTSLFIFVDLFVLFKIYEDVSEPFFKASLVTFTLIVMALSFSGRPSVFSMTDILLSFYILGGIKKGTFSNKYALLLYPLSILELLCHASFYPILLSIYLMFIFSLDVRGTLKRFRYLLYAMALSIVTSVMTPYGPKLPFYIFYSYGLANYGNMVQELKPPTIDSIYTIIITISLILVLRQVLRRHADGVLLTLFGVLSLLLHVRNMYLLSVLMVPMLCDLASSVPMKKENAEKTKRYSFGFFVPFVILFLYIFEAVSLFKGYAIKDSASSPVIATSYLLNTQTGGNIYCGFNQGAFLEFNGFDTYIDARPELYFKKINERADVYKEYVELSLSSNFDYNSFIKKYGFEYFIVEDDNNFNVYLKYQKGYEKILEGNGYILYRLNDGT